MQSRLPIVAATLGAMIPALVVTTLPSEAAAQETHRLKFQAAWPSASTLWENFVVFTERVNAMSGGRLEIEALPAGAVVPPFELLDAVSAGVLDGAHWAATYSYGKNTAVALFGPAPGGPWGMDLIDYLGWHFHGGGLELYRELFRDHIRLDVVPLPLGAVDNQVLGWFNREIEGWEDLAGLKCRQTGITAEVFGASGMATVNLPGGEILPAAERGVIDCAEWVGPGEDIRMGFHQVFDYYYMPSVHEPTTALELIINPTVWDRLAPDLQEIMQVAAMAVTVESQITNNVANAKALAELQEKHGVEIRRTPEDILIKTLEAWDEIKQREAEQNPFFQEVLDSQREWAAQVVRAKQLVNPPPDLLHNYYWPQE
jgi:TRAP-type mannitol/chloroaromatic compound transport system substrate-binding protein